ncbi:hypothetical protein CEQ51_03060 [Pseudomonas thivervalensis]|uniref:Uncharacterized protein n=1 Tax=Pseudomonas thivervalensis TaxID=86265 RepID=A0A2Z4ZLT3_9PSED|nr:hypothetical protein CE140_03750 [Pseudomonas thivervalensis]AXA59094.1 hypothetical protein CEQ51_03060 [Pseudomonas thivervalensis]
MHAILESAFNPLWRGSLLPLGRAAAPCICLTHRVCHGFLGAAAQPSGSKLPRHGTACLRHLRYPSPSGTKY